MRLLSAGLTYQRYIFFGAATLVIVIAFLSLTGTLGEHASVEWPSAWTYQRFCDTKSSLEESQLSIADQVPLEEEEEEYSWGQGATLQEALPQDQHYLFSFYRGGWTNQVMCMLSSIHLAVLSHRIPLLDAFIAEPVHMPGNPARLLASEVFDLPRLARALGLSDVVEVEDFKAPMNAIEPRVTPQRETLGCWSYFEGGYRGVKDAYPYVYGLDAEMTPLPEEVMVRAPVVVRTNTHKLAALIEPGRPYVQPQSSLNSIRTYNLPVPKVDPEDRIACVDNLFSATTTDSYSWDEIEQNIPSGTWDVVGRHLRWTAETYARGQETLRRVLELPAGATIPPFVAVHMRRDDFPGKKNFEAIDYAHAAHVMVNHLQVTRDMKVAEKILILTDESNMEYRANVTKQYPRLHFIDHNALGTVDRFGVWYPIILDSVIISMSSGFIGTAGSTMSILSCRRMASWNSGQCSILTENALAPAGWTWPI